MFAQCGIEYLGLSKNVSKSLHPPAVVTGTADADAGADADAADAADADPADAADVFPPVVAPFWIFHVPAKEACSA